MVFFLTDTHTRFVNVKKLYFKAFNSFCDKPVILEIISKAI